MFLHLDILWTPLPAEIMGKDSRQSLCWMFIELWGTGKVSSQAAGSAREDVQVFVVLDMTM